MEKLGSKTSGRRMALIVAKGAGEMGGFAESEEVRKGKGDQRPRRLCGWKRSPSRLGVRLATADASPCALTGAACVNTVQSDLRNVSGVANAMVKLATGTGVVDYASDSRSVSRMVDAVRSEGFCRA